MTATIRGDGQAAKLTVPCIDTARLRLVPLTHDHGEGMFALWREPEVCRHSGDACDERGAPITLPARSRADSDGIIRFFLAHQAAGRGFRWAMLAQHDGVFIGALGFNSLGARTPDARTAERIAPHARAAGDHAAIALPEIAFHLHPSHWGSGYMHEACVAALHWIHEAHGATAVEAWAEDANAGCLALLRRLGFTPTDASRDGARRHVCTLAR